MTRFHKPVPSGPSGRGGEIRANPGGTRESGGFAGVLAISAAIMGRIGPIPQGVHAGKRAQIPGSKSRISCLNFAAPPRSVRGGRPFFGICPPAREKRDVARLRSKLRGRRQTAPRLSAPSRTQGRDLRPDLFTDLGRGSASRRAIARISSSACCSSSGQLQCFAMNASTVSLNAWGFSNSSP
jgi:hypothetical protein